MVTVELRVDASRGWGECVPYPRYGETVKDTLAAIAHLDTEGLTRTRLQSLLQPGAARNAVDCALWDVEAKRSDRRVWESAGLAEPKPVVTAFTLSLDTAEKMGAAARENALRPLLKLKLQRCRRSRAGARGARTARRTAR